MTRLQYIPIVLNGNVVKQNKKFVIHAIRKGMEQRTFCLVDLVYDPYVMQDGVVTCARCLAAMKTQEKALETMQRMREINLQK